MRDDAAKQGAASSIVHRRGPRSASGTWAAAASKSPRRLELQMIARIIVSAHGHRESSLAVRRQGFAQGRSDCASSTMRSNLMQRHCESQSNFSWRQTAHFCRSRRMFAFMRCAIRFDSRDSCESSRANQRPNRAFSASLTACGLALPPVAFMTCPTNQPSMPGLALACSALSGLAATTTSIALAIALTSVT
jgi:hypothetical protein